MWKLRLLEQALNSSHSEMRLSILFSLDVLEHLGKPKQAVMEIHRVSKGDAMVAISLPLENLTQRMLRIGFMLMKISRDSILKGAKNIPITKTPEYHYVGDVKSYNGMVETLKVFFHLLYSKYTPIGLHKSLNINGVHVFQKRKSRNLLKEKMNYAWKYRI